jgi:aryl-alcohol dehydrogenase-like predicted oxidoreductase
VNGEDVTTVQDRRMTTIEYRTLGTDGPAVSTIGLGCNNFGRIGTITESLEGTRAIVEKALELGVTLFDTADMYGGHPGQSEEFIGAALKGDRDRIVLATKFGHEAVDMGIAPGAAKGSRAYIRVAIADSLRRLQTDHVDLYQMHTPDPSTPIQETIAALEELVDEGKILHYGHSNFSAEQIAEAARAGGRFVSAQNEYSLISRGVEKDVLPAVVEFGLGFLPYFPLANGLFTGKFSRTERPTDTRIMRQRPHIVENAPWDAIEAFEAFCAERGLTILEGTFGWLLAQPNLASVIAGATRPEQLEQNAAAAVAWKPTAEEVEAVSAMFA